jgi:hypothetical protein
MRLTKKQRDDKIKALKRYSSMKIKSRGTLNRLKDTATPSKKVFYDLFVGIKKFRSYKSLFAK